MTTATVTLIFTVIVLLAGAAVLVAGIIFADGAIGASDLVITPVVLFKKLKNFMSD